VKFLGEDTLVLLNGTITVVINGDGFLTFIKSEFDIGKALNDIIISFETASSLALTSLDLASMHLRSQVSAAC